MTLIYYLAVLAALGAQLAGAFTAPLWLWVLAFGLPLVLLFAWLVTAALAGLIAMFAAKW